MNDTSQVRPLAIQVVANDETRHRALVVLTVIAAVVLAAAMAYYGWDYYVLSQVQRPFSHKHLQLKPSGTVGLKLGMFGLFLFALVYLYPLRKRWMWLARQGKAKHWLDFHIILGLAAPVVITFHSAFKIQGFAGMAWWTMIALVISGLVGRYFYAQIPHKLDAATMTLKEMEDLRAQFVDELSSQNLLDPANMARLFNLPDIQQVRQMSLIRALFMMVTLDLARPLKVWSIRRRCEGTWGKILSLGGILRTRHYELERAIRLISKQAALSKRILFISKAERVFFLWHVIHRPFSLSFAIFVIIHVGVVVSLGFF
jgi:hypothetical protein